MLWHFHQWQTYHWVYIVKTATLANYADDSTLSVKLDKVKQLLSNTCTYMCSSWSNPKKFQAMFLDTRQNDISLELCGKKCIRFWKSVVNELLGVHNINDAINLGHITSVCTKASEQLNVRNIHVWRKYLNENSKMFLFQCFVLCHFSYSNCCIIWQYCGQGPANNLETVWFLMTIAPVTCIKMSHSRQTYLPWRLADYRIFQYKHSKF